ncbi:MAG: class IV adenylate cyclase [Phycisphaerae bacterium]|jgi:predicted adenylyl cyclase CyaB
MQQSHARVNQPSGLATEVELKFRLRDPQPLRDALRLAGAVPYARIAETNTLFDAPDQRLMHAGCGLRLRSQRSLDSAETPAEHLLTFKGPRQPGAVKVRAEFESTVGDALTMARILEALGFAPTVCYEKRREPWRLRECEVCVDELPQLGWFAEVEGPDADAVCAAAAELGLADGARVEESYVTLAWRHGNPEANAVRRLKF